MYILALDSSSSKLSITIKTPDSIDLYKDTINNSQAETLFVVLENILTKNKCSLKDLSLILVCNGPGSFTGTRIGIASIIGIVSVLEIPVYSIDKFTLGSFFLDNKSEYFMGLDIGKENYYLQKFNGKIKQNEAFVVKKNEIHNFENLFLFEELVKDTSFSMISFYKEILENNCTSLEPHYII